MTASLPPCPVSTVGATVGWYGQNAFVTVEGGLDFFNAREGQRLLLDVLDHEPHRLIIDAHTAFVDSSGVAVLVHVAQRAKQERREFRLICHQRLAAMLRLHGLNHVLGIDENAQSKPDQSAGWPQQIAA